MLVVLVAALSGCGGQATHGTATLWVTRDRGAQVMLVRSVPAGETAMQALERTVKLKTSYGGRFVQGIDGVDGSLSGRRDWFYFVNGVAPDKGATEVALRPGDVEWWDYRSWGDGKDVPVVVGAFPEPFLHGFDGSRRAVAVRYGPGLRSSATRIGRAVGAVSVRPLGAPTPSGDDVFVLTSGPTRFVAAQRTPGTGPSTPVQLTYAGSVRRLLDGAYARRFSVP
jgi:hypothetical protein